MVIAQCTFLNGLQCGLLLSCWWIEYIEKECVIWNPGPVSKDNCLILWFRDWCWNGSQPLQKFGGKWDLKNARGSRNSFLAFPNLLYRVCSTTVRGKDWVHGNCQLSLTSVFNVFRKYTEKVSEMSVLKKGSY